VPSPIASTAPVIVVEPFANFRIMNVSFGASLCNANLLRHAPYLPRGPHGLTAQHLANINILQHHLRLRKIQQFVIPCCVPSRAVKFTASKVLGGMKMWHLSDLTVATYCLILSFAKDKRIYDNYPVWFYFVLLVLFCIIVYMVVCFVCFCLIL
jgi:hypothetical protein